jgi:O-antigen/teichoic acid export membrane protein
MTPIIIGVLGDVRYGFWVLLMSIVGHYSFLDFGLSFSMSRFFAGAIGRQDDDELAALLSTTLSMMLKIGGVALGITLLGIAVVPLFGLDAELSALTRWIILFYGMFMSIGFPVRVFRSLLKSHLRYDMLVMASTIQIVLANSLVCWFLLRGHGLFAMALINVCAGLIEYVIVVLAAKRCSCRGLDITRANVDPKRRSEILRYSLVSFVTQLGYDLRSRIDPLIIGSVIGYSAVTLYAVGTRFPIYLTDVVGAVLGGQLLAVFSQSQGKTKSAEESTRQFVMATRVSCVIALFCGSSMIFYGREFIARWMGEGYETSYHILAILMVPYIFSLMQYPSLSYIYSLAKHRYLAITAIAGGLANLILSLVLVHFLGIYGVVWATFCEMLVVYLVVFPLVVCRASGINPWHYYGKALGHPVLVSLAILGPFFLVADRFLMADYLRLASLGMVQIVFFAPLAFLFILGRSERDLIMSAFKRSR